MNIFLKIIKTAEEVDIFWRIASPLIGEYVDEEYSTFIWMGGTLLSSGWATIMDNHNIQSLVVSKWIDGISNDPWGLSNSDKRLLMGRYKVEVSNLNREYHEMPQKSCER